MGRKTMNVVATEPQDEGVIDVVSRLQLGCIYPVYYKAEWNTPGVHQHIYVVQSEAAPWTTRVVWLGGTGANVTRALTTELEALQKSINSGVLTIRATPVQQVTLRMETK